MEDVVVVVVVRRPLLHCSPPFLPKNLNVFKRKGSCVEYLPVKTNTRLCQQNKNKTQNQIKRGKRWKCVVTQGQKVGVVEET
jgi:hypothetical protein